MQQLYVYETMVTGYARRAMNKSNITYHPYRAIIEHRIKVLMFYDRYGQEACREAFGVSRSTIYLWKQKLSNSNGQLSSLAPASRAPRQRRKRTTDQRVANFVTEQRKLHPRLGKDKLARLLHKPCTGWGVPPPSVSTVGRILGDLKSQGLLPSYSKVALSGRTGRILGRSRSSYLSKKRRGSFKPRAPGELVQIDTVVKFINGLKRYCITAVDVYGRFSFAYAYRSPSSANAADFLSKLQMVAPFEVKRVQTDNGSEFYKHFHKATEDKNIVHYWNYPRHPKMNARVERFNRTIQEEFMDSELDSMAHDLKNFNHSLMDWLIWYNTERPHFSLGQIPPMQYLITNLGLSNMLWTHTTH
jgi:putative transposase